VATRDPTADFGCDYCADEQNRLYGHVAQVASSEDFGVLLRCPRCGTLYEDPMTGSDEMRRLTAEEAAQRYGPL
jgi:hypothetical protein